MNVARLFSGASVGLKALLVDIEVDVERSDKPSLVIVGLPEAAVQQ
ncbi:MAG TPA: hypothetical protein VN457_01505 [Chlamydiales bacterium]|nr:hypothetical protein [Chlamydiales bacterium]